VIALIRPGKPTAALYVRADVAAQRPACAGSAHKVHNASASSYRRTGSAAAPSRFSLVNRDDLALATVQPDSFQKAGDDAFPRDDRVGVGAALQLEASPVRAAR